MERFKRFYGQLRDNDYVFAGSIDTTSFNEEEMGIHGFYLKESVFINLVDIYLDMENG